MLWMLWMFSAEIVTGIVLVDIMRFLWFLKFEDGKDHLLFFARERRVDLNWFLVVLGAIVVRGYSLTEIYIERR